MSSLDVILIGVSIAILGFVGFSVKKQYRYATQLFDMLRFYPFFIVIAWLISDWVVISRLDIVSLLIFPVFTLLSMAIIIPSLRWMSDYESKQFLLLLKGLRADRFSIISFEDYVKGNIDSEKVNVCLRHDVDISLPRAEKMARIQKEYDVQATYFFRLHAEKYTFEEATPLIKQLTDDGFKIGLHYETLSQANGNREKAIKNLEEDIARLREVTPVSVVAAHGQKGYKNREIWADVDKDRLGVSSAYDMKYDLYLSDAGGKRLRGKDGKYLFDRIYEAKPGQIVQILIHPDWWI